jgi:hypothetical protein
VPDATLNAAASVKLNASGGGQVSLGPRSAEVWHPQLASIQTILQALPFATCFLYYGAPGAFGQLLDSTYNGNSATSARCSAVDVHHGQSITAVWAGGTPGDTATLQLQGTRTIGGQG